MDWKPGLIVRIKDYRFEDNGTTRDKYAIVLLTNDQELYLIHTLTTSQNHKGISAQHYGCAQYQHLPYFFIPAQQKIGDEDFFFEKDTFIFFNQNIRKERFEQFIKAEQKLFGIVSLGQLHKEELKRLLKCILKSDFLPRNLEIELRVFKETL